MSKVLEEIKAELINESIDSAWIDSITRDLNENMDTYIEEWFILNLMNATLNEHNTTLMKEWKELKGKDFAHLSEAGTSSSIIKMLTSAWKTVSSKADELLGWVKQVKIPQLGTVYKVAGIALVLSAAAFALYKAAQKKYKACKTKCGKDKVCMIQCKINVEKTTKAAIQKAMKDLDSKGALTEKKKAAYKKKIEKIDAKIKKLEDQLKKAKSK